MSALYVRTHNEAIPIPQLVYLCPCQGSRALLSFCATLCATFLVLISKANYSKAFLLENIFFFGKMQILHGEIFLLVVAVCEDLLYSALSFNFCFTAA